MGPWSYGLEAEIDTTSAGESSGQETLVNSDFAIEKSFVVSGRELDECCLEGSLLPEHYDPLVRTLAYGAQTQIAGHLKIGPTVRLRSLGGLEISPQTRVSFLAGAANANAEAVLFRRHITTVSEQTLGSATLVIGREGGLTGGSLIHITRLFESARFNVDQGQEKHAVSENIWGISLGFNVEYNITETLTIRAQIDYDMFDPVTVRLDDDQAKFKPDQSTFKIAIRKTF